MKLAEDRVRPAMGLVPMPAAALSTFFGCGVVPGAPGTVGSAAAVAIAWALTAHAGAGRWTIAAMAIASFFVGVWASAVAARAVGRKDPGFVVIDEVSGQWFTLLGCASFNWKYLLAAFALFRVLDILKPPPVRQLERIPSGWGIMLDDVAAGLMGALVLAVVGWFNS